MIDFTKKQYRFLTGTVSILFLLYFVVYWSAKLLFGFSLAEWTKSLAIGLFGFTLIGANLLYYWKGAGAEERDRDENLRIAVVSLVIIFVMLGFYFWPW